MKLLVCIVTFLMLCATPLYAQSVSTDGLSKEQIAELVIQAEKMKKVPATLPSASEVKQYVELGEGIGKAIGATARELGVAVNDFADSYVGKVSLFLIVWHLFGGMLVHVIAGFLWFTTFITLWVKLFKKQVINRVMSKEKTIDKDGKTVVKYQYYNADTARYSDQSYQTGITVMYWITLIILTVVGILITFVGW